MSIVIIRGFVLLFTHWIYKDCFRLNLLSSAVSVIGLQIKK